MRWHRARAPFVGLVVFAAAWGAHTTPAHADEPPPRAQEPTEDTTGNAAPPAAPPPDVRWYTLDTPHFHIHFYEDERPFALHAGIIAERAYRLNTRYLNWRPSGRVDITLDDHTDAANGYASSVPNNFIFGYGAPPGSLDELNDFDDYLKLLITHEFTHVVHLDTIYGLPRLYNFIHGKLWAPNLSQPNWFIEGLAVLMETRQTTGGRLRSTMFDMELRVPFLEERALGLDAVSNGPLAFPNGTAAYLYGSSVLKYVEDRYGPRAIREISHEYGQWPIPGAMNRIAMHVTTVPYVTLWSPGVWESWRRSMSHKFALEIDEARRRGLTEERRLTHEAPGPASDGFTPKFFRDGSLLYHRTNNDQAPAFMRLDPATGAQRELAQVHGAGLGVPTPDGRAVVFQRVNYVPLRWRISNNPVVSWNDLFRLDLATGEQRELTRGRRAETPDVSPDGTQIVCTVGAAGTRKLALVPITGGAPRVLGDALPGLAYSPTWSPDGRFIVYSRWKFGGYRDIHLFELATGTDRALMHDRAYDVDPHFSPDGRYVVFSSDRTGIYNIFAYELATSRLFQVTNVLAGAFQPTVSPDGKLLVYMGFSTDGFDLFSTPFDPWTWLPAQPSANARLDAPTDPGSVADSPDALPGEAPVAPFEQTIRPFAPWKYFYPRSWNLNLISNPLGTGSAAEVSFGVADPVGNHAIAIDLVLPSDGDPSARIDYSYNRLWPAFGLSLARGAMLANDLIVDGARVAYRQHTLSGSLSTSLPVLRTPAASADLSFGYSYSEYAPAFHLPVPDPTHGIAIKPEIGPDANLYLSWDFSNAHSWPYSISYQEGRRLQLNLQVSDPSLGSRFHTTEITWSWAEYLTPPWARLQALALLYTGGIGLGDKRAPFYVGGYEEQDLLRALLLNRPPQCCAFLRGYAPNTLNGDQFHVFSAEYRAPLVWIERGYETFPVYLRRIYGAVFADVGDAFVGQLLLKDLRTGVGAELRMQFKLFYYVESGLELGVAKGLSKDGGNQIYLVSSSSF
jgi:Tol biopolymer transport system component